MGKVANILVVDDDHDIAMMIKMILEYNGFNAIISKRAQQTKEILRNHRIDLIILDMLIAGVKGTDVCKSLKKDQATAYLPIMMISALSDAEEICLAAGADDFISKPFDLECLLLKINNLINRPSD